MDRLWTLIFAGVLAVLAFNIEFAHAELLILNKSSEPDILKFEAENGTFLDVIASVVTNSSSLTIGPDGDLYVPVPLDPLAGNTHTVRRYNWETGEFVGFHVKLSTSSGITTPGALSFGPDGNLYVAYSDDSIRVYDGTSGLFQRTFLRAGSGGLVLLSDFVFGPTRDVFVVSRQTSEILRYDGETGDFKAVFVPKGFISGAPLNLAFGPDGNLYVTTSLGIFRFQGTTGDFLDVFINWVEHGIADSKFEGTFAFGSDGYLYAGIEGGRVFRYNLQSQSLKDVFIDQGTGGLVKTDALVFTDVNPPWFTDTIIYPQLAVGGGFEIVILATNKTTSIWTGRILPNLPGDTLPPQDLVLGPRETKKVILEGGTDVLAGYLEITGTGSSTRDTAISYFYNYFVNGKLVDSTGVPEGEAGRKFMLGVEKSSAVNTGLAIRRIVSVTEPITAILYDSQGTELQRKTTEVGARFFTEIFDDVPANFLGSIVLESQKDFYLTALRLEATDSGFQLTSVPPSPAQ
jgi:hypothetical protein